MKMASKCNNGEKLENNGENIVNGVKASAKRNEMAAIMAK